MGVFCIQAETNAKAKKVLTKLFPEARDSKKLSPQKREEIFKKIRQAQTDGHISYTVQFESAKSIDTKGLSWSIRNCIKKGLRNIKLRQKVDPSKTLVLLDGGLKAPAEYIHQKTIIRGDDSEIIISLASIAAKVIRDRHMKKLAKIHPVYGFDLHKGYGTAFHRRVIQQKGCCIEHRQSFLRNI